MKVLSTLYNEEDEGGQWCCYAIQRNSNTITCEGQGPICEVLARTYWKADLGQEASGGCNIKSFAEARAFYTLRRLDAKAIEEGDNVYMWLPTSSAKHER